MSLKENATTIAENVPKVYEAGQKSMVDESKIIAKTASGLGVLVLPDVSEIPHDINVQLSSNTIANFSAVPVVVCGDNLLDPSLFVIGRSFYWGGTYDTPIGYAESLIRAGTTAIPIKPNTEYTIVSMNVDEYYCDRAVTVLANGNGGQDNLIATVDRRKVCINFTTDADTVAIEIRFRRVDGAELSEDDIKSQKIMLLEGTFLDNDVLEYQTYINPITYTPDADGKVVVSSVSPIMKLICDADDVTINVAYYKSYGMHRVYDYFWDVFQNNGNRRDYSAAFKSSNFNAQTFRPKYDLICSEVSAMFQRSSSIDLAGTLDSLGLTLDISAAPSLLQMFQGSGCTRIPVLDARNAISMNYAFGSNAEVREIEKLMISEKMTSFSSAFSGAAKLEKLIVEGTIARNGFDVHWSTLLSHESLISILNALKDYSEDASGTTWTVTLGSENVAKLTEEEQRIAYAKGWVIA